MYFSLSNVKDRGWPFSDDLGNARGQETWWWTGEEEETWLVMLVIILILCYFLIGFSNCKGNINSVWFCGYWFIFVSCCLLIGFLWLDRALMVSDFVLIDFVCNVIMWCPFFLGFWELSFHSRREILFFLPVLLLGNYWAISVLRN